MLSVIPEDRSKNAWIAATWKEREAPRGPSRVHRHGPRRRRQGRRSESKTLDDSKHLTDCELGSVGTDHP